MPDQQEIDKKIHDILREGQFISIGRRLDTVELMMYRAIWKAGFEAGKEASNDS